jgi:hypothetical protein
MKIISQFADERHSCLNLRPLVCCHLPLRGHSPLGRGKQSVDCSLAGKVFGAVRSVKGCPTASRLRLPLDTRQRYRLRRNGVKGGR